jgi:hypothetical protein
MSLSSQNKHPDSHLPQINIVYWFFSLISSPKLQLILPQIDSSHNSFPQIGSHNRFPQIGSHNRLQDSDKSIILIIDSSPNWFFPIIDSYLFIPRQRQIPASSSSRQGTRKVLTFSFLCFLSKLRWEWFCWFWFWFIILHCNFEFRIWLFMCLWLNM